MIFSILLVFGLSLYGALNPYASGIVHKDDNNIDSEFTGYVSSFEEAFGVEIFDITIKMVEAEIIGVENNGVCLLGSRDARIYINKATWDNVMVSREALIFHELGHCVFNLNHHPEPSEFAHGRVYLYSIMHPYTIYIWDFDDKRESLISYMTRTIEIEGVLQTHVARRKK